MLVALHSLNAARRCPRRQGPPIADLEEYRASCAEGGLGTDAIADPLPQLGQHHVFPAD